MTERNSGLNALVRNNEFEAEEVDELHEQEIPFNSASHPFNSASYPSDSASYPSDSASHPYSRCPHKPRVDRNRSHRNEPACDEMEDAEEEASFAGFSDFEGDAQYTMDGDNASHEYDATYDSDPSYEDDADIDDDANPDDDVELEGSGQEHESRDDPDTALDKSTNKKGPKNRKRDTNYWTRYSTITMPEMEAIFNALRKEYKPDLLDTTEATREEMKAIWPYGPIADALIKIGSAGHNIVCLKCRATLSTNTQFGQDVEVGTHVILPMWIPGLRSWHYKDHIPPELVSQVEQLGCMFVSDIDITDTKRSRNTIFVWCDTCQQVERICFLTSTLLKAGMTRDIEKTRDLPNSRLATIICRTCATHNGVPILLMWSRRVV